MLSEVATSSAGFVMVSTTNNGGHPPEYWAERAVEKIIHVSEKTPAPLRQQAEAFREQVKLVVDEYMRLAIQSDRSTVAAAVEAQTGDKRIAGIIRNLSINKAINT